MILRLLGGLFAAALILALPRSAAAYPFTIAHGYTACAQCHVDPSGGGALTEYGRGQSEIFIRSVYRTRPEGWEPGKVKDFAFGVQLPKPLTLQFDTRSIFIPEPDNFRYILMQADGRAHLQLGKFRAYGSLGAVSEGGYGAWVTSNPSGANLVAREYWLGCDLAKGLTVRAGRMALPFGIRSEEHLLFARTATRTDTNDDQQLGLDAFYGRKKWHAELMGIGGNFQLSPDDYRERGYAATGAFAINKKTEVGVSSLLTHADLDIAALQERTRQAHGVYARSSPVERLALFAEADLLLDDVGGDTATGSVGYLQADVEPVQGLHVKATGEWCDPDHADATDAALRGGGALLWFLAPHADIRLDAMVGPLDCSTGPASTFLGAVQWHLYL